MEWLREVWLQLEILAIKKRRFFKGTEPDEAASDAIVLIAEKPQLASAVTKIFHTCFKKRLSERPRIGKETQNASHDSPAIAIRVF